METRATRADAAPPKPLNSATTSGISIILIRLAQIRPRTRPAAIVAHSIQSVRIWFLYSVTPIAAAMQTALSRFPAVASFTLLISRMPIKTPAIRTPQRM